MTFFFVVSFLAFSAPGSASCWLPMSKPARESVCTLWQPREHGLAAEQGSCFVSDRCLQMEIGVGFTADGSGFLQAAPASSLSLWLSQKSALRGFESQEGSPGQERGFSVLFLKSGCAWLPPTL